MVTASMSQGSFLRRNLNCPLTPLSARAGSTGIHLYMKNIVSALQKVANANITLQLTASLRKVPSGTPSRLATVMPMTMTDTAVVLLPSEASFSATMLPTPKNAPWGSPEISLEHIATQKLGAKVVIRLPMSCRVISPTSMLLRGLPRETSTARGAPMHTPSAYAEMRCPASGIDTPRSDAILGSMPIITYSVIPNPRVPSARA